MQISLAVELYSTSKLDLINGILRARGSLFNLYSHEVRAQYEFALANLIFWKMIPAGVKYICEIGTVVGIQIQHATICENCIIEDLLCAFQSLLAESVLCQIQHTLEALQDSTLGVEAALVFSNKNILRNVLNALKERAYA